MHTRIHYLLFTFPFESFFSFIESNTAFGFGMEKLLPRLLTKEGNNFPLVMFPLYTLPLPPGRLPSVSNHLPHNLPHCSDVLVYTDGTSVFVGSSGSLVGPQMVPSLLPSVSVQLSPLYVSSALDVHETQGEEKWTRIHKGKNGFVVVAVQWAPMKGIHVLAVMSAKEEGLVRKKMQSVDENVESVVVNVYEIGKNLQMGKVAFVGRSISSFSLLNKVIPSSLSFYMPTHPWKKNVLFCCCFNSLEYYMYPVLAINDGQISILPTLENNIPCLLLSSVTTENGALLTSISSAIWLSQPIANSHSAHQLLIFSSDKLYVFDWIDPQTAFKDFIITRVNMVDSKFSSVFQALRANESCFVGLNKIHDIISANFSVISPKVPLPPIEKVDPLMISSVQSKKNSSFSLRRPASLSKIDLNGEEKQENHLLSLPPRSPRVSTLGISGDTVSSLKHMNAPSSMASYIASVSTPSNAAAYFSTATILNTPPISPHPTKALPLTPNPTPGLIQAFLLSKTAKSDGPFESNLKLNPEFRTASLESKRRVSFSSSVEMNAKPNEKAVRDSTLPLLDDQNPTLLPQERSSHGYINANELSILKQSDRDGKVKINQVYAGSTFFDNTLANESMISHYETENRSEFVNSSKGKRMKSPPLDGVNDTDTAVAIRSRSLENSQSPFLPEDWDTPLKRHGSRRNRLRSPPPLPKVDPEHLAEVKSRSKSCEHRRLVSPPPRPDADPDHVAEVHHVENCSPNESNPGKKRCHLHPSPPTFGNDSGTALEVHSPPPLKMRLAGNGHESRRFFSPPPKPEVDPDHVAEVHHVLGSSLEAGHNSASSKDSRSCSREPRKLRSPPPKSDVDPDLVTEVHNVRAGSLQSDASLQKVKSTDYAYGPRRLRSPPPRSTTEVDELVTDRAKLDALSDRRGRNRDSPAAMLFKEQQEARSRSTSREKKQVMLNLEISDAVVTSSDVPRLQTIPEAERKVNFDLDLNDSEEWKDVKQTGKSEQPRRISFAVDGCPLEVKPSKSPASRDRSSPFQSSALTNLSKTFANAPPLENIVSVKSPLAKLYASELSSSVYSNNSGLGLKEPLSNSTPLDPIRPSLNTVAATDSIGQLSPFTFSPNGTSRISKFPFPLPSVPERRVSFSMQAVEIGEGPAILGHFRSPRAASQPLIITSELESENVASPAALHPTRHSFTSFEMAKQKREPTPKKSNKRSVSFSSTISKLIAFAGSEAAVNPKPRRISFSILQPLEQTSAVNQDSILRNSCSSKLISSGEASSPSKDRFSLSKMHLAAPERENSALLSVVVGLSSNSETPIGSPFLETRSSIADHLNSANQVFSAKHSIFSAPRLDSLTRSSRVSFSSEHPALIFSSPSADNSNYIQLASGGSRRVSFSSERPALIVSSPPSDNLNFTHLVSGGSRRVSFSSERPALIPSPHSLNTKKSSLSEKPHHATSLSADAGRSVSFASPIGFSHFPMKRRVSFSSLPSQVINSKPPIVKSYSAGNVLRRVSFSHEPVKIMSLPFFATTFKSPVANANSNEHLLFNHMPTESTKPLVVSDSELIVDDGESKCSCLLEGDLIASNISAVGNNENVKPVSIMDNLMNISGTQNLENSRCEIVAFSLVFETRTRSYYFQLVSRISSENMRSCEICAFDADNYILAVSSTSSNQIELFAFDFANFISLPKIVLPNFNSQQFRCRGLSFMFGKLLVLMGSRSTQVEIVNSLTSEIQLILAFYESKSVKSDLAPLAGEKRDTNTLDSILSALLRLENRMGALESGMSNLTIELTQRLTRVEYSMLELKSKIAGNFSS